ncbi:hypothetical protein MKZ02_13465 [Pseudobacillus sp. FSL P4-0506]
MKKIHLTIRSIGNLQEKLMEAEEAAHSIEADDDVIVPLIE